MSGTAHVAGPNLTFDSYRKGFDRGTTKSTPDSRLGKIVDGYIIHKQVGREDCWRRAEDTDTNLPTNATRQILTRDYPAGGGTYTTSYLVYSNPDVKRPHVKKTDTGDHETKSGLTDLPMNTFTKDRCLFASRNTTGKIEDTWKHMDSNWQLIDFNDYTAQIDGSPFAVMQRTSAVSQAQTS